jgi:hypothetical protein
MTQISINNFLALAAVSKMPRSGAGGGLIGHQSPRTATEADKL